jgi:tryptophan synthase alpha chain
MSGVRQSIVVEYLGKGLYSASSAEFPDCRAVADSEEAAAKAVEDAIRKASFSKNNGASDSMNPIDAAFQRLRSDGKKAFIPFITAGDPDVDSTGLFLRELAAHGADLIEVGFPYSDPIADGPVIQASYTRALANGTRIDAIFQALGKLSATPRFADRAVPIVAMISYSLVQRRGLERFIAQAQKAGISGAIVPDLPLEEAEELTQTAARANFRLILLATPTTPRDRAVRIAQLSTGFLYYVSITGITGERDQLPAELVSQLSWLRRQTELPICVGFGISKPEHARLLRDVVDGVIVGSALVRKMEHAGARPLPEIAREIANLAESLAKALND